MDARTLHSRIEVRLAAGILPRERPTIIFTGMSKGREVCAACDETILVNTAMIESRTRFYHGRCYAVVVELRTLLPHE